MTPRTRAAVGPSGPAFARRRFAAIAIASCLGVGSIAGVGAVPDAFAQESVDQEASDGQTSEAGSSTAGTTISRFVRPAAPRLGPAPVSWPAPETAPAAAHVLMDAGSGQVLSARAADEPRAVASTVKVLTALSVVSRSDLDDRVTVGEEVLGVAGSGVGLAPGDTWSVAELLDAVISRSGNEAAEALAVHVGGSLEGFLAMMRADAAALGLGDLPLVSPSGLDDANRLSAMDLATLARVALTDDDLRPFLARRLVTLPSVGVVETRNELLLVYPDATGVKTGFTEAAGFSLIGSARRDGRELIAVVLDAGEEPARFAAAAALLDLGFDEYRPVVLRTRVGYAVAGGEVVVRVPDTTVTVPLDASAVLRPAITVRPPDADVVVDVEVDGEVMATVPGLHQPHERPSTASAGHADDGAIGRALVDGAYAALRAAASVDSLR